MAVHVSRSRNLIKKDFYSRSPTPLRGEHEQLLGEGVEEDDEDSRLEAALRGELKAEAAKGEDSQVRSQKPFISAIVSTSMREREMMLFLSFAITPLDQREMTALLLSIRQEIQIRC